MSLLFKRRVPFPKSFEPSFIISRGRKLRSIAQRQVQHREIAIDLGFYCKIVSDVNCLCVLILVHFHILYRFNRHTLLFNLCILFK